MTHPVHSPKHYTSHPSGIECIEITRHMGFNLGNAVKYLWRNGLKDGQPAVQDLEKAIWYIQNEIERMQDNSAQRCIAAIEKAIKDYLDDQSNNDKMLFLDTETTGLDDKAQAIQIAIVDEDGKTIVNTLLDTDAVIDPKAYQVHRIDKRQLKAYPYFEDIQEAVSDLLSGRRVGIYNADFDVRILKQSGTIDFDDFTPVCVMKLAKDHLGESKWLKLTDACERLGIEIDNAHDALCDALATAKVHQRILDKKRYFHPIFPNPLWPRWPDAALSCLARELSD